MVHIGTPRQQVSRDARTAQVENEAEDDSVVNAYSGLYQRANRFSPLTAEIEEEPQPVSFVTQPESFVLRPTVAESD